MFCSQCGSSLTTDAARFCPNCGAQVETPPLAHNQVPPPTATSPVGESQPSDETANETRRAPTSDARPVDGREIRGVGGPYEGKVWNGRRWVSPSDIAVPEAPWWKRRMVWGYIALVVAGGAVGLVASSMHPPAGRDEQSGSSASNNSTTTSSTSSTGPLTLSFQSNGTTCVPAMAGGKTLCQIAFNVRNPSTSPQDMSGYLVAETSDGSTYRTSDELPCEECVAYVSDTINPNDGRLGFAMFVVPTGATFTKLSIDGGPSGRLSLKATSSQ